VGVRLNREAADASGSADHRETCLPGHDRLESGRVASRPSALESLGYELAPSIDERNSTAHRFKRGESTVDVVTSGADVVDVLVADHAAPRMVEKIRGRTN